MTDTTSAAPSLLPCPFCGANASGHAIDAHEHSAPLKALGIPDHQGSYVIEGDCQCGSGLIGDTQEEVTARWNRRVPAVTPSDAEIDAQWRESVEKHETTAAFVRDFARTVLAKWGAPPQISESDAAPQAAPVAQGDALTPAARDVLAELERVTDDLAALVRKLVRSLRKTAPDNELADKALDYLKRKGLQGSPLRHNASLSGGRRPYA